MLRRPYKVTQVALPFRGFFVRRTRPVENIDPMLTKANKNINLPACLCDRTPMRWRLKFLR